LGGERTDCADSIYDQKILLPTTLLGERSPCADGARFAEHESGKAAETRSQHGTALAMMKLSPNY
jgi:hypothetical protein